MLPQGLPHLMPRSNWGTVSCKVPELKRRTTSASCCAGTKPSQSAICSCGAGSLWQRASGPSLGAPSSCVITHQASIRAGPKMSCSCPGRQHSQALRDAASQFHRTFVLLIGPLLSKTQQLPAQRQAGAGVSRRPGGPPLLQAGGAHP